MKNSIIINILKMRKKETSWRFVLTVVLGILLVEKAVGYNYDYMQELCEKNKVTHMHLANEAHTYGYVKMVRSGGYNQSLDCTLYIWAPNGYNINVQFRRVDTYKPHDGCSNTKNDQLLLTGNTTTHDYCGTYTPPETLISTANMLKLQFLSFDHSGMDGPNTHIGFDLYYTAFHTGVCDTYGGREYRCKGTSRCIPGELTCDGRDNCGNWSDEKASICGLPVGSIVMITLICLLVVGTCVAAAVYYVVESKSSGSRRRSRSRRSNNEINPGPYTIAYDNGSRMTSPPVPPPYSSEPPAYTALTDEKKEAPPPSYQNLAFDGDQSQPAETVTDSNVPMEASRVEETSVDSSPQENVNSEN